MGDTFPNRTSHSYDGKIAFYYIGTYRTLWDSLDHRITLIPHNCEGLASSPGVSLENMEYCRTGEQAKPASLHRVAHAKPLEWTFALGFLGRVW